VAPHTPVAARHCGGHRARRAGSGIEPLVNA